jgi:thiol-disulfide isomerase/thioredoxin
MISFRINNTVKCIRYVFLLIALLIINCNFAHAGEIKFVAKSNDNIPFRDDYGYLPEGMEFEYPITVSGHTFHMADLRGNVVILVFFTTWCHNCPGVLKNFDDMVDRFRQSNVKNVKIFALNVGRDNTNITGIYYKGHNVQMLDVCESIPPRAIQGIPGVPACLVFDKKGKPVCAYIGAKNYESSEFIDFIIRLAKQE